MAYKMAHRIGDMGKTNHIPGKLAAVALKHLKDGMHADGGNLYLLVRGTSKSWVFRFTSPAGGRRQMGLGPLHAVPLAEARKRAAELREQLKHPTEPSDPLTSRQEARLAQRIGQRRTKTFRECATAYIEAHQIEWKNPKHAQQWTNTLDQYAYPVLGDLPASEIDEALVLNVLTPIWNTKTETAKRLRGRIESVLDWATFNKYRQGENPARWKGHLEHSLAKPSKVARVTHHAAMPYQDLPAFMQELRGRSGLGAKALEFLILTGCRSGEIRGVVWSEIDLGSKLWVIPAQRMKMAQEHRVPLSAAAVDLLISLPRLEGTDLIFPSSKPNTPLSDMTLTAILRRSSGNAYTVHGFRSCFRDWLAETTNYPNEACELALAHSISNKVEAAYRRGDMLDKRFQMMNDWAKYCGGR
jgi:integrase